MKFIACFLSLSLLYVLSFIILPNKITLIHAKKKNFRSKHFYSVIFVFFFHLFLLCFLEMGTDRISHKKNGSHAYSVSSTRASMDLIEDTTQRFSKNEDTTAHVQRERWDAFFEPQYSFGAFIHQSSSPISNQQEHHRNLDRLIDDGNVHIKSSKPRPSADFGASPRLPTFTSPISAARRDPETEARLKERLQLLKQIRTIETEQPNQAQNMPLHWKAHLAHKAAELRKKFKDDGLTPESSPDLEKIHEEEEKPTGINRSFLCFILGFLFPPFWLLGAFYISSYANKQTSASRRIDHIWRRRSRIAFGMFTVILMIVLVVVFVVKPGSVGWRQSKQLTVNAN